MYRDHAGGHGQLQDSLEAVQVHVLEQNTKKSYITLWVEQNEWTKQQTALSCDFWGCNVLVRNAPSVTGDLFCKRTKNQVRLSHWEVYLFRRQRFSTGQLREWPGWIHLPAVPPPAHAGDKRAAAKLTTALQWPSGISSPRSSVSAHVQGSPLAGIPRDFRAWVRCSPKGQVRTLGWAAWKKILLLSQLSAPPALPALFLFCPGSSCSLWAQIFPLYILGRTGTFHSVFQNLSIIPYGPP